MSKAIAITATQQNPFIAAADSVGNMAKLTLDFMYGTQERARFTMLFAMSLAVLAYAIGRIDPVLLQNCAI